jgi:5-methylthioadenosine/S-adenosylhomocysteine deaminase
MQEMRCVAALLAKAVARDAEAMPAHQALALRTLGGAIALGLGRIADHPGQAGGPRVPGYWAGARPRLDPVSHLVYAAGREHVTDVWVGESNRSTTENC